MEGNMEEDRRDWARARDELVETVVELGFPEALGNEIVKNLGSAKAMRRMTAYLWHVKPEKVELVVDEMLAIKSEIDAWKQKKTSQEAGARYYMMRRNGIIGEEE